jgi:hypothetical protein
VETGRVPLFLSSRDRTCELTEVPDPDSLPENSRELWATLRTLAGTAPPETRPGVISADELAALEHRHAEEMAGLEARLQGDRIAADRETRRVQARRLRSRLLAAMERPAAPRPDPEAPPS